ncbi:Crp/Fnr family transcriptional regulator [Paenibacillaceae bacterium T2]|uniref:Crp/Fnr family transcriptional regulator n=2 Tax=Ferviditalea candida TaxID=3108399 RepID=A0ABU5ZP01_9BACL|nr:Crp/Fnr family transcriptional regulator [Paenibacillaceae bacterium T2]
MLMTFEYQTCHNESSCIRRVPVFQGLSDEEIMALHKVTKSRSYGKGNFVFREGEQSETLFVLNRGTVKIVKISDEGKEQIIRLLFPGDFFGLFALLQEKIHYADAEVLETAEVCLIQKKDFKAIIESNPHMAYRFMLAISERLQQADEWIGTFSLLEVERRLAKMLLAFYNRSKAPIVQLPVPKKELAALLGTTPETLSRKLAHFESLNILSLKNRKEIRILDADELSRYTK